MKIWDEYNWKFWHPVNEPLPENPKEFRKVSICTTVMDRTYDLRKTLELNIIDNADYCNAEFVVLNYGSNDDLDDFITKDMKDYVSGGILKYVKVDAKHYDMGRSRNIAFKSATGDIVNNVDADNYTGRGFCRAINQLAELEPEKAVFAKGKRMMHGRIGMYKNEFLEIGGYDEDLVGYGFDDHSLVYRAMAHFDAKFMWWTGVPNSDFMNRIKTPKAEKGKKMVNQNWRETEGINKKITMDKMSRKEYIVNRNNNVVD